MTIMGPKMILVNGLSRANLLRHCTHFSKEATRLYVTIHATRRAVNIRSHSDYKTLTTAKLDIQDGARSASWEMRDVSETYYVL